MTIPVDFYSLTDDQLGTYLLDAVPQVGHEVVFMDMEIVWDKPQPTLVHGTVVRVVWAVARRKDPGCEIRSVGVYLVPYREPATPVDPKETSDD